MRSKHCWRRTCALPKSIERQRPDRRAMASSEEILATRTAPTRSSAERWAALIKAARARAFLLTAASLILGLAIWQVFSSVLFNPFLIPPPTEVFRTAVPMLISGEIFADIGISMSRILIGFITGSAVA